MTEKLLVNGSFGIYIPQRFAENYNTEEWNISEQDKDILLAGPEHPDYWEVWDYVLRDAYFIDNNSITWTLYQDGDLFAVDE